MDSKAPLPSQELPVPASTGMEESIRRKRCKKLKVFRKLGVTALLLWVGSRYFRFQSPISFKEDGNEHWPIPTDMSADCASWSDSVETDPDITEEFPYSAEAAFELPVSADTLFLLSRSHGRRPFSSGNINYVQSGEVSDSIKVDITAYFWHEKYLDASKACLLKRDDDHTGVGIFTKWDEPRRRHRHEHQKLRFDVRVTFPRTEDDSPLDINHFFTDLEIYSQTFADLSNVAFGHLGLRSSLAGVRAESLTARNATIASSLGPIKIQSLVAPEAYLATSMAPIEGTFNGSHITLTTSNAPIKVDVNLFHESDHDKAQLKLHTQNSPIEANLNLISSKDDSVFDVIAHTAHGRLGVDILSAPLESTLTLHATTALAPAYVGLPITYEGSFHAETSLGSVTVAIDGEAEDPAGKGRKRIANSEGHHGRSSGKVGWSEEGMERGEVTVVTSLSAVEIKL
ncbi:54S ribosomal protein L16, mitochondrial [Favolaschia claudopus]|uniref:54S ribosomal protein L16, mitochondrial n=1 Tax=Favolaschia claudopus TaxID=2862362 RepID=A0AAW0ALA9_9AGAR